MRFTICFFAIIFTGLGLHAQSNLVIPIETKDNALLLTTGEDKRLYVTYFGQRLASSSEYAAVKKQTRLLDGNAGIYNSAYTPSGSWSTVEPAIQVTHADGNTSLDLQYISHASTKKDENVTETSIVLKDPVYPVEVVLHYRTFAKENVLEQWTVIRHQEKKPVILQKMASANLYFYGQDYFLTHYHGTWAQEMRPEEVPLTAGIKTLDSKLGTRANMYEAPSFMVSFGKSATENEGDVLLGTLSWSGNFRFDMEVDSYHNLRLIAGMNSHASDYSLPPSTDFQTPSFISCFSKKGKGEASRNLHDWARKYRLLNGNGSRLTLLNNWEATYFNFNEKVLTDLFADGKKLGVDVFLLDDGWFGNKYPRNDDKAGLGDWQENVKKLPNGIGYLVKEAEKAGIKFGIWVEPEMVNPKSELYEQHPDWVIREPQRPETYMRNQLVLDLSNPEVQKFVYNILDNLFTKNPKLAFIKWDCNSVMYNPHSKYLEKSGKLQSQLYIDYVKGLYAVLEKLRAKYPDVPMMLCSGGGGRVDYGALQYFTEFWVSDNTDPLERIFQQWEYSYFFPAIAQCNHVTDWGKQPLKFRTDVAMMGKLGYDIVVSKLSAKDLQFSQEAVANYKSLSDVIWHGDLYRLVNPRSNPLASLMIVGKDRSKAVMFSYLVSNRYTLTATPQPVVLSGLDPASRYQIKEINLYPDTRTPIDPKQVYSGDFLMKVGINPQVTDRRASVVLEITKVN